MSIIDYIVPEYTITFDTTGGTSVDPIVVTEGAMLGETIWTPPVVSEKNGYTFDDWYKNAAATIPVTVEDTVTSDITLYASWTLDVITYTVTYNSVGGTYIAPEDVIDGELLDQPTSPTKIGYIFDGWYEDPFFLTAYDFNDAVGSNMTLYASWILDEDVEADKDLNDWVMENIILVIFGLTFLALLLKR